MQPTISSLGLDKLSPDERIRLMHDLYDSIPTKSEYFPLTQQENEELEQEVQNCRLHPEEGLSWDETKKQLDAVRIRRQS
jgi:putative addiction module component (TIGR02574 family)